MTEVWSCYSALSSQNRDPGLGIKHNILPTDKRQKSLESVSDIRDKEQSSCVSEGMGGQRRGREGIRRERALKNVYLCTLVVTFNFFFCMSPSCHL